MSRESSTGRDLTQVKRLPPTVALDPISSVHFLNTVALTSSGTIVLQRFSREVTVRPMQQPRSWFEYRLQVAGLKQIEIARMSGLTRQSINRMARGDRPVSARVLRALRRLESLTERKKEARS